MKKEYKKPFMFMSFIIIIILLSLAVLNFIYTERTIEDELTGYGYSIGRLTFIFYNNPRLTLVFGENEIEFEMSESNMKNWTPCFDGVYIQDFKNNYVNVYYKENIYGNKIVTDIKFVKEKTL